MEILTIRLAANERKTFERAGRYVEIIESEGPIDVLMIQRGTEAMSARAALSGIFVDGTEFDRLDIVNGLARAQVIRLLVSAARGGSRRQPGTVSVVDGELARTLAGLSFAGSTECVGAASQSPHVALLNAAASTNRVVVRRLDLVGLIAGQPGSVNLALYTMGGTALTAAWESTQAMFSRLAPAGGPALTIPNVDLRTQRSASGLVVGATGAVNFANFNDNAATLVRQLQLATPIVLLPGTGLVAAVPFQVAGATYTLRMSVDGYLDPIT